MMLPKGWKESTLHHICGGSIQTGPFGSQLHAYDYKDTGVSVLMPKDIFDYRAMLENAVKISENKAQQLSRHILKSGDILFSRRGDVARMALINSSSEGSICGTGCLKATPTKEIFSNFLFYYLQLPSVRSWLENNAVGQTMLNMNTSILASLPLIIPPLFEQKKIAAILSTWDRAIEKTEALLKNSEEQLKALMQQLLTGKKRLPGFTGKWAEKKLGEVASFLKGRGLSKEAIIKNGDTPCIHYGSLFLNQPVVIQKIEDTYTDFFEGAVSSEVNDVLMPTSDVTPRGLCVASAIMQENVILGGDIMIIRPREGTLDAPFLSYLIRVSKKRILRLVSGSTVFHLYGKEMAGFWISFPSLPEQKAIASVLTTAQKEVDKIKEKLARLKLEKSALMQQLLTGKRRVLEA